MSNVIPLRTQNAQPTEWPACETIEEAFLVAALAFMDVVVDSVARASLEGVYAGSPTEVAAMPVIQIGGKPMTLSQVFAAGGTMKQPAPPVALALFHLWRKLQRIEEIPVIATYRDASDLLLRQLRTLNFMEATNEPA